MNFVMYSPVTLKLFSLSFMPLLAPNPSDARLNSSQTDWYSIYLPGGIEG